MPVTLTDHRTVINQADNPTTPNVWTGTTTLYTSDPTPIESTGELGATVGVAIFDSYVTITSDDLSDAVIYCWVFSRLALGNTTDANGGLMVSVGDATNLGAWKVAGADRAAFRHDDGPTGWQCPALDTTSLPASPLSRVGSAASVSFTTVTRVGTTVNSLVAAPGMNPTYLVDIIRALEVGLNNGCALSVIGGTSGVGNVGTFADIAAADRATGDLQAHGVVRQLGTGVYGCQGPLRFGNATGSDSSWFEDSNATLVFESRGFRTTLYKIFITDNGTGTTTFILENCALIAPTGVGASFDSLTDTDVTAVTVTGTRIDGFTGGVGIGGGAGQIFTNCIFSNGGAISVTSQPVDLSDSSVLTPTVAADASALVWNVNTDTNGYLDGMSFTKGTNAHHAIQLGTSSPITVSLVGITFTGFNASNEQNDSSLYLADRGSDVTWTINVSGGAAPSYKRARGGDTVNIVSSVNVTVTVLNQAGAALPGVEVAIFQGNTARTVILASTPTDNNGQVSTTAAQNLSGGLIIRARQSANIASFNTTTGISGDTITTSTASHTFQNGDALIYSRNGGSQDIGPEPGTWYAGNTNTATGILQLYDTAVNAIAGGATGRQTLTSGGGETHTLDPVRYVAASATAAVGTSDVAVQITMVTDAIATG